LFFTGSPSICFHCYRLSLLRDLFVKNNYLSRFDSDKIERQFKKLIHLVYSKLNRFEDFNPNLDPTKESDAAKYSLDALYATVFNNANFPNGYEERYGVLKDVLFFHRAAHPLKGGFLLIRT
jgi:hypothetical protein